MSSNYQPEIQLLQSEIQQIKAKFKETLKSQYTSESNSNKSQKLAVALFDVNKDNEAQYGKNVFQVNLALLDTLEEFLSENLFSEWKINLFLLYNEDTFNQPADSKIKEKLNSLNRLIRVFHHSYNGRDLSDELKTAISPRLEEPNANKGYYSVITAEQDSNGFVNKKLAKHFTKIAPDFPSQSEQTKVINFDTTFEPRPEITTKKFSKNGIISVDAGISKPISTNKAASALAISSGISAIGVSSFAVWATLTSASILKTSLVLGLTIGSVIWPAAVVMGIIAATASVCMLIKSRQSNKSIFFNDKGENKMRETHQSDLPMIGCFSKS